MSIIVVVSLQNYSVSVTSYLKAERPFCQTSQCGTVATRVQWFKVNDVNVMLNSSIITDPTEVSEVDEEATEVDKEAIGEEESKKEELGSKGDRDEVEAIAIRWSKAFPLKIHLRNHPSIEILFIASLKSGDSSLTSVGSHHPAKPLASTLVSFV